MEHRSRGYLGVLAVCVAGTVLSLPSSAQSPMAAAVEQCNKIPDEKKSVDCLMTILAEENLANPMGEVTPEIARYCARKWADDFSMESFCREQQANDRERATIMLVLFGLRGGSKIIKERVAKLCAKRWYEKSRGSQDWSMFSYCVEQQLSAAKAMGYK